MYVAPAAISNAELKPTLSLKDKPRRQKHLKKVPVKEQKPPEINAMPTLDHPSIMTTAAIPATSFSSDTDGVSWQTKIRSLMSHDMPLPLADTPAASRPSKYSIGQTMSRHNYIYIYSMLLHRHHGNMFVDGPPTLPRIEVPGGMKEWSKRLKQSKTVHRTPSPLMQSQTPVVKKQPLSHVEQNNQKQSPPKDSDKKGPLSARKPKVPSVFDLDAPTSVCQEDAVSKQKRLESKMLRQVIQRIDTQLSRKRMRVQDLFQYCDGGNSGVIGRDELEDMLRYIDVQLPEKDVRILYRTIER
jgi:hypothetical protein